MNERGFNCRAGRHEPCPHLGDVYVLRQIQLVRAVFCFSVFQARHIHKLQWLNLEQALGSTLELESNLDQFRIQIGVNLITWINLEGWIQTWINLGPNLDSSGSTLNSVLPIRVV